MNLSTTIIPKSDQLNADDLIAGPITIRVTAVEAGSAEQPVTIRYDGDKGRPYKPGKSMRRVLVHAWGSEGAAYVGRSMTLYRAPEIKFGGEAVGGIRISHLSHLNEPMQFALTETRGKRKQFRVEPLVVEAPPAEPVIDVQTLSDIGDSKASQGREALHAWWKTLGNPERAALKDKLQAWKEKVA